MRLPATPPTASLLVVGRGDDAPQQPHARDVAAGALGGEVAALLQVPQVHVHQARP
jgi:hypothetical protein